MAARTPEERSTLASIAAHERWAGVEDRTAEMANATRNSPASIEYWMKKVDPEGRMTYANRLKAAKNKKSAYYQRLTLKMRRAKAAKQEKAS